MRYALYHDVNADGLCGYGPRRHRSVRRPLGGHRSQRRRSLGMYLLGHDQKGLTLVEIMVAMIILAIALAWLAPLLVIAMRGNRFGGDLTEASTLAQDKIEEFRNVSYSTLLASPAGQDTVGKMMRNWAIAEEGGQDGLARIVITIHWQDDKGHDHQAEFVTMQARAM